MSTFYKFIKKHFKTILIIGLLIQLANLSNFFGSKNDEIETINVGGQDYELLDQKIDTVVVEKEVTVTEYVPTTIIKRDTVRVQIPADVDTTAILDDYFATYTVVDTLKLDYDFPDQITDETGNQPPSTLGFGILRDEISQNKIKSRNVKWTFQVPTVYNTTIVKELPKNEFYLGGGIGYNEQDFLGSANIGLVWKTKKQRLLVLDGGFTNDTYGDLTEYNPYISLSYYIKLGKK